MSNKVKITKSSFCIVASTLPIGFIAAQIEELRIKRIYVLTKTHELAYQNLKKLNPSLEIVRLPSALLLREACYLFMLMRARLGNLNVIFFHECCLPIFDLLLCTIKPRGYYFPMVTMSGWNEIEPIAFPRTKFFRLFQLLGVIDRFRYYSSSQVGGNDIEYVTSMRNYPRSVTVMKVDYSRKVLSRCYSPGTTKTKSILFVVGKSFVADAQQVAIFRLLAAAVFAKGYECHIKDHPNSIYRLNLQIDGAVVKDPLLPVDLMDKDYHLAVGVSSTALLLFNERAISLINLLDGMSQENRLLCVKHYDSALPNNRINYIRSLEEFEKML
jgi:hypothetical protein